MKTDLQRVAFINPIKIQGKSPCQSIVAGSSAHRDIRLSLGDHGVEIIGGNYDVTVPLTNVAYYTLGDPVETPAQEPMITRLPQHVIERLLLEFEKKSKRVEELEAQVPQGQERIQKGVEWQTPGLNRRVKVADLNDYYQNIPDSEVPPEHMKKLVDAGYRVSAPEKIEEPEPEVKPSEAPTVALGPEGQEAELEPKGPTTVGLMLARRLVRAIDAPPTVEVQTIKDEPEIEEDIAPEEQDEDQELPVAPLPTKPAKKAKKAKKASKLFRNK